MPEPAFVPDDSGWYVDELVSTLVLSGDGVRLVEWWSVVAVLPLDELLVELNLDSLEQYSVLAASRTEVSGGEITDDVWPPSAAGRPVIGIRLPQMLEPGQPHHLDLVLAAPRSATLRRHVFTPPVLCRRLEFRVHFGPTGAPAHVTRIGDALPGHERAAVDVLGDVSLKVRNAVPGRLYGVSW